MHRQKILSRSLIVVAFALLAAPWAGAQQYRIAHADYGWRDHRVDVTQRLRELARHDARFRMGNSTFGIDPAPGHVKTLRIFAKGPGGRDRVFEYREGQVVDGAVFSGWGRGDWGDRSDQDRGDRDNGFDQMRGDRDHGGSYMILRALYGTRRRNVDVTDRLRELARHNLTFRMGNSTFGIDPAPGRVKELRIFARGPHGQTRVFSYREGSVVDGGMFSGWGHGDWGRGGWHGGWDSGRPR
ncbi:MAG TPA: hypothetical protein VFW94_11375 [Candidatus Acidoferrales bacterium]|nr:hypothetical protein [Candidatus Acidoferrales bacterium]